MDKKSYSIYVDYKSNKTGIINVTFEEDSSVYVSDLISRHIQNPEFGFYTYQFKLNQNSRVKPDPIFYSTKGKPKFSHHPKSGLFQISGHKVISGFDIETKKPKGFSTDVFNFDTSTNDGGPIITGLFWGLNLLSDKSSKTSEEIVFDEGKIRYQNVNNRGNSPAFAVFIFHLPIEKLNSEDISKEWIYYHYANYKKPILLRILKNPFSKNYVLGVSIMNARTSNKIEIGFHLSGGSDEINPLTNTCRNVVLIFPKQEKIDSPNEISLDYLDEV